MDDGWGRLGKLQHVCHRRSGPGFPRAIRLMVRLKGNDGITHSHTRSQKQTIMWLTYYVPGGDAELNGRLTAWSGYRSAMTSPSAELRAARAANAALANENARLRGALD